VTPLQSGCVDAGRDQVGGAAGCRLCATFVTAVWLLMDRVCRVVEIHRRVWEPLRSFGASHDVAVVGAPAAVAAMFLSVAISLWLLPGREGIVKQFADRVAQTRKSPCTSS
jgi:hypothetical protein